MNAVDLASLLCSRLCHVLLSPVGALNNGLEWMTPGPDWSQSIIFSILILILVFRPEGLLGERTPEGA